MTGKSLKDYLKQADAEGAVPIVDKDVTYYIVSPKAHADATPSLFANANALLQQPQARAAYSDRTAWLMASLAELAYITFEKSEDDKKRLIAALGQGGLALLDTFNSEKTGTQAFLAQHPGLFNVLVFRGTEKNKEDILSDINARFFSTPEGKAHKGFITAFDSVYADIDEVLSNLEKASGKTLPLFICGHSLGGALATVAAQELEEKYLISACYTYGCPRVGTSEWSDCVKAPIYRVVNGADVVPSVPGGNGMRMVLLAVPHIPFLGWLKSPIDNFVSSGFVGFQHAGDLRFVHGEIESAKLKIGSAATWERFKDVAYDTVIGSIRNLQTSYIKAAFADHSIALYRKKLKTIADNRND